MFSNLVTAAKGLFARPDSEEAAASPSEGATSTKMVAATRQQNLPAEEARTDPDTNSKPITNGKRKARPANSLKLDGQLNKRRKRTSLEMPETMENGNHVAEKESGSTEGKQADPSVKSGHVRFGSEEPEAPASIQAEEISKPQQDSRGNDDESSDDDEAPETIDNSAEMSKVKTESQRVQKAKQREEQLKKEKRRHLDERRKLQAKLAAKKLEDGPVSKPGSGTPGDDMVSESTVTLQGSTTQDSRRSTLPTLLPDEILNAEPVARPPTPPAEETGARAGKPNKLKFLDKVEKPPKDVSMGDVMIRVLDEPPSQKKSKPSLPPKASKTGRSSKDNWLKNNRSTAQVNGLRRTAGGKSTSSFVRK